MMIEIPILLIGPYCREEVVDHLIIPERRRHRGPKPDRLPALELLASSPNGVSEAIMMAHGFTVAAVSRSR
jgi:hypothetical protein